MASRKHGATEIWGKFLDLSRTGLEVSIALAGVARDAGRFGEAARHFRAALAIDPGLADIWVQLGNMEKDRGGFAEAEAAYRHALELGSNPADTNLQLGRCLKLAGNRTAARDAYLAGLDSMPASHDLAQHDLAQELASLGDSWSVQQRVGLGLLRTVPLARTIGDLREVLDELAQMVPDTARLAVFPTSEYDLYRRATRTPEPAAVLPLPLAEVRLGVLVLANGAKTDAVLACLASLQRQSTAAQAVIICTDAAATALERLPGRGPVRIAIIREAAAEHTLAAAAERLAGTDWIAVVSEPVAFDEQALAWLSAIGGAGVASLVTCDEDARTPESAGHPQWHSPRLAGSYDPERLDQGFSLGTLAAGKATAIIGALGRLVAVQGDYPGDVASQLIGQLSSESCVAHIPEILVSRMDGASPGLAGDTPSSAKQQAAGREIQLASLLSSEAASRITVIIPTRDKVELLRRCVDSLRTTAADPIQLEIVIVDNGSRCSQTSSYLSQGAERREFTVRSAPMAFNWSLLNNQAAAASTAGLLVFANNDLEMRSTGWDDILRRHFARPDVGAVGARLLYPDETVQHAGVVLGAGKFGAEHDGRNAGAADRGPEGRWVTRRTVMAVTGAFLACRREDFERIGGFDGEQLPIWFNDVDFCLKVTSRGLRVVYEPAIEAIHYEGKTLSTEFEGAAADAEFLASANLMRQRWGRWMRADPFYSPHYAPWCTPSTAYAVRAAPSTRTEAGPGSLGRVKIVPGALLFGSTDRSD